MYIEDIIINIKHKDMFSDNNLKLSEWDYSFLNNIFDLVTQGNALSHKQASVINNILIKNKHEISNLNIPGLTLQDIEDSISFPTYKKDLYISAEVAREVRWIGDSCLAFRSKKNQRVLSDIKSLRIKNSMPYFSSYPFYNGNGFWIVFVNSTNVQKVLNVISDHNFQYDDDVVEFLSNVTNSTNKLSSIITTDDSIVFEANNHWEMFNFIINQSAIDPCTEPFIRKTEDDIEK